MHLLAFDVVGNDQNLQMRGNGSGFVSDLKLLSEPMQIGNHGGGIELLHEIHPT